MSRRLVRQDVVARLNASAPVGALVTAGAVYDSRTTRIPVGTMPAIVVFIARTKRTRSSAGAFPAFRATHTITLDCFNVGSTDVLLAQNLDILAETVLDALLTDGDFVAQFEELGDASEEIVLEAEADNRHGLIRITIDVSLTDCYEPATVTDLATIHTTMDLDGDGLDPDADDFTQTIDDLDL